MAQTLNERFEGGTNGTALSTSNTSFGNVNLTNATAVFDNSIKAAGSFSGKIVQTANFGTALLVVPSFTTASTSYLRMCAYMAALPSGGTYYIAQTVTSGSVVVGRIGINSSGNLVIQDAGATIATSTTTLSATTQYRLEWDSVGTSSVVRIYSSPSATSPVETVSGTSAGSTYNHYSIGIVNSANTTQATLYVDEIITDSSVTPGPVVRAATATASLTLTASGSVAAATTATASITLIASGAVVGSAPQSGDSLMSAGATAGQAASDALGDVAQTETGAIFVRGDGNIVFTPRHARYNPHPVFTFGEQELPYSDIGFDFDTTHLSNQVTVSRPAGTTVTVNDAASQLSYYVHNVSYTLQLATDTACLDAANYLLSRYSQPSLRVQSMVLKPMANKDLWPSVLGMELGTCVTVNRRPPASPIVSQVVFVDHLEHVVDFSGDGGSWTTTVVGTPADVHSYLVWDGAGTYGEWDLNNWAY